ncbi:acyl-CoA thioesterase [Pseudobacteriovorax antillogorgiicola]|uniref:Acyl-CoA hydrolase n=1 Tax=Pseudobacteriovorax antillogorgiicola TaxID=1513793 RepID=A0A1Y6B9M1_9BACT|nr:acyl-CoA thioesterase [Pseudobacteriovorax antillogorgiicola]TCS58635.1 acyl-CoA hydrolase [Pseudobacteriovorax antillogorgiicola]SME96554.1 Acyl-CoA hydrolase [Pseudobacteriovorax antillogorgiicola]
MSNAKYPSESEVIMTELVLPQHTNELGTVFGGMVMSWVDIAAAICAQRHCGKQVVTASVDAMEFRAPVRLGWIMKLLGSVNNVWKSSCEVGVKVIAENPKSGEVYHTASAYVTMVALDSMGRPTAMPVIEPETEDQKRRFQEAQDRKVARLELKKKRRQS